MTVSSWLTALLLGGAVVLLAGWVVRRRRSGSPGDGWGRSAGPDDPLVEWVSALRPVSDLDVPADVDAAAARMLAAVAGGPVRDDRLLLADPTGPTGERSRVGTGRSGSADERSCAGSGRGGSVGEESWVGSARGLLGKDPAVAMTGSGADSRPARPWSTAGHPGPTRPSGRLAPPGRRDSRRPFGAPAPSVPVPAGRDATGAAGSASDGQVPSWRNPSALLTGSPRRALLLAGVAGAAAGGVLAGPVAAVAAGGYGTLALRALLRRWDNRRAELTRRRQLDQLCGLAADLRAGLPATVAGHRLALPRDAGDLPAGRQVEPTDRLPRLALAAVRLADRTGAPLAELLERIEADARAADRGLAAAAAQAAGARATAWLLAALPIGGIGLGYGIGVDPVSVLLHTPVGGGCAVAAIVLQVAGLLWAERLGAAPGRTN